MASIQQSSLNDFFKSKRSARDGLSIKGANKGIGNDTEVNNVSGININKVKEELEIPQVELLTLRRSAKVSKPIRRVKVANKNKHTSKGQQENIAAAFQKAAALKLSNSSESAQETLELSNSNVRKRERDNSDSDGDAKETEEKNEPQQLGTATTVQEKSEELPPHKRHKGSRTGEQETGSCTPEAGSSSAVTESIARETRGSARKKLDMAPRTNANDAAVQPKNTVKLSQCNKLSELRAQLLKVRQCEGKLEQFRATVKQAQFEAEGAAALVTKSKGGIPSPRKVMKSPMKAASPRKLFPPHKSLSSPYKAPHPQLEAFSSLQVEVPVSPCKTPSKSPGKVSSPVSLPAYQRFQHLIHDESKADISTTLTLPYKYRVLREVFRACDTVVSLLHNRQEVVTFSKLRPAVQQMLRRSFVERQLGQLKQVFPLAYVFKQEKIRPGAQSTATTEGSTKSTGYQLTISANLDEESSQQGSNAPIVSTPRINLLDKFNSPSSYSSSSVSSPATSKPPSTTTSGTQLAAGKFRKMDSCVLVERRSKFHAALVQSLHQHHAAYLKSLTPSVVIPEPSSIQRWHPSFPLDEVPDIEAASLPQPPHREQYNTAASVLATARNLFSVNPRLQAAVEKVAGQSSTTDPCTSTASISTAPAAAPAPVCSRDAATKVQAPAQPAEISLALKGISVSLLAKIRAREAATASRTMMRSASDTRELGMLSQLPQMARILRHTSVSERKAALPWEHALAILRESHSGMLAAELEQHLELLIKEVPDFVAKHKLSSGVFVKVNKKADINAVIDKLDLLIKQKS